MSQQSNGQNLVVQGRIVWVSGTNLFEGKRKTDFNTGQVLVGVDGSPVVEYGFGLAVPKFNPATGQPTEEFTKIWNALYQEAFTLYPSGNIPPGFAMKFKDGDTIDDKGIPFAKREGYAGHIVLSCTTQIPIKFFIFEGGNNILVNTGIKNGDYVNVQLNVKSHAAKGQGRAGLYLNPSAVQLIQSGKEIINTPSGDQIFGQAAPAYAGQVVAGQAPVMPNVATGMTPSLNGYAVNAPMMPQQAAPHYPVLPQQMQPAPTMPQQTQPPMGNVPVPPVGAIPTPTMQMPVTPTPLPWANGSVPTAYPSNAMMAPVPPRPN